MKYLLDTHIIFEIMHAPLGHVATRFRQRGVDRACTSIVVAAEARLGVEKNRSRVLAQRLDEFFAQLPVVSFESPADSIYAAVRSELERAGKPIGGNDMLIAAHALALGCTLVTDNVREFSRIKSLAVENWLR